VQRRAKQPRPDGYAGGLRAIGRQREREVLAPPLEQQRIHECRRQQGFHNAEKIFFKKNGPELALPGLRGRPGPQAPHGSRWSQGAI